MTQQHQERHGSIICIFDFIKLFFKLELAALIRGMVKVTLPLKREDILTYFYRVLCFYVGIKIRYKVIKISVNLYKLVCTSGFLNFYFHMSMFKTELITQSHDMIRLIVG